jgi:hypothetical protein
MRNIVVYRARRGAPHSDMRKMRDREHCNTLHHLSHAHLLFANGGVLSSKFGFQSPLPHPTFPTATASSLRPCATPSPCAAPPLLPPGPVVQAAD